jgi:recombination protein RecR
MNSFDKLIRHFERFPGIGSRQARRFAFHILTQQHEHTEELAELILTIRSKVAECVSCRRFFSKNGGTSGECSICSNAIRDRSKLTIVERDNDIDAIERSGGYNGLYFVLGGTIPLLESRDTKKLRGNALKALVESRKEIGEIILGFSVNPDGENTGRYVEMLLKDPVETGKIKISHLGRGLSTGSELEYADPETIKNALINRS